MYKQMKPKRFKTVRRGSKRMQGISREVRVLDLQAAYGISENALTTLDGSSPCTVVGKLMGNVLTDFQALVFPAVLKHISQRAG